MKHLLLLGLMYGLVFVYGQDSLSQSPALQSFHTEHEGTFNGSELKYSAHATETFIQDASGKNVAALWSVAYLAESTNGKARPVTFVFNGGPGSASVWLHMGFFGPRIVKVDSDAVQDDGSAPYVIVDNPQSLLDITDLVFIDPIGTGYSRVLGKAKEEDFWGLKEDAKYLAQFLRKWVTQHQRWNAPKYIAGESFGTTRAAALAHALEEGGQNMAINGLMLISQALDYAGSTSAHHNVTSYFTYLPAMAATAWYHKKAGQGKSLEVFLEEARSFCYDIYSPALHKGNLLTEEEKGVIAEILAYFTGLDKAYILRSDLRILVPRFQKELLRKEGLAIGRLDGRYTRDEFDATAEKPTLGDPSSYGISGAYTAALHHYMAAELGIQMNRPYLTSNKKVNKKWNWRTKPKDEGWEPSYVNTAPLLGETMRRNTSMKVLVASGYYDLITPFFDAEYTFARNGIVKDRVTMTYYEGGHMMYNHQEDFEKLAQDIRRFLVGETVGIAPLEGE